MNLKELFNQKRIQKTKGSGKGKIKLFNNDFFYHHGTAFYNTYKEIFEEKIYEFKPQETHSVILDCGANMGLSILYFSKYYPNSEIITFEPDEDVIPFLEKNIQSQNLNNVELLKVGVWTDSTNLEFYTDHGLGGRMDVKYKDSEAKTIKTVRLRKFLNRPIDMLKMDIEGPEYLVLKDCEDLLKNVSNIFVEYHSFFDEDQELDELLALFKRNGFRYHLKESFSRKKPFIDKYIVCEKYDMAINVFAYKK